MYQITGKQISFRVNDDEKEELNALSLILQEESETKFTNSKHIVLGLLSHLKTLENKVKTLESELISSENKVLSNENKVDNELQTLINQAKSDIGYDTEDISNEAVLKDLLEIINMKPEPAPTVEIIKEVEVERKLNENEVLLNLTEKQSNVINLIARWRLNQNLDSLLKTPEEIIKAMVFTKGSLLNYTGEFTTGIKNKNLK